jgi:predicted deacetylase
MKFLEQLLKRKFILILISMWIVVTVIVLNGAIMWQFVKNSIQREPTVYALVRNQFCVPKVSPFTGSTDGKKFVILRIDDVQAHAWSEISKRMIRDAQKYKAPVVAGIIAKDLDENESLVNFLKREECNIEAAFHWFDHNFSLTESGITAEFSRASYEAATLRIKKGAELIEDVSREKVTTFIPPLNMVSDEARRAASDNGMEVVSAVGSGVFDYGGATFSYETKQLVDSEKVVQNCKERFKTYPFCVIMLHPQDYTNQDGVLIEETYRTYYLLLLEKLAQNNVSFTTFKEIKRLFPNY